MFLVGLELDLKLLKGRAYASVAISLTSIVFPFLLGLGVAAWLYRSYSSPSAPLPAFLLFMGAAMSVTAFPVLARILSERGLTGSRVGAISLACAAVDDVSAWCMLAMVVAVTRAHGFGQGLATCALSMLFIAGMLGLVKPLMNWIDAVRAKRNGLTPTVIASTLGMLLLSSGVSEVIGIHALFGAFLFGVIVPRSNLWAQTLAERLETIAVVLLMPLFFAFSGLRTNIGLLGQPAAWIATVVLILCATVGKFGGSVIAARVTGLRWREASAVGILMNTRGLVELVVLNVGMDLGVISGTMFTMLVIMALVTTAATTPILRWVYPDREMAREADPGTSFAAALQSSP
jgi:Kef-type K+ transport system membrane component KefB